MKKIVTTDDILNDRTLVSQERADRILENVAKEVAKVRTEKKSTQSRSSKNK